MEVGSCVKAEVKNMFTEEQAPSVSKYEESCFLGYMDMYVMY